LLFNLLLLEDGINALNSLWSGFFYPIMFLVIGHFFKQIMQPKFWKKNREKILNWGAMISWRYNALDIYLILVMQLSLNCMPRLINSYLFPWPTDPLLKQMCIWLDIFIVSYPLSFVLLKVLKIIKAKAFKTQPRKLPNIFKS
jgi:hypothetical protein